MLVFCTAYLDSKDRTKLTDHWLNLHMRLNPECDFLIVDSQSPQGWGVLGAHGSWAPHTMGMHEKRMFYGFPDNVGHLSRGGRDGWGRAFCYGLDAAVAGGYDYVAHIEGDSLFRVPVGKIIGRMRTERLRCATTKVSGMRYDMPNWIETGLMFFDTAYLRSSGFTARYSWHKRRQAPTPEVVIYHELTKDGALHTLDDLKAWRGDKQQINHANVVGLNLDWVTHCHNDVWVYDRFIEAALREHDGKCLQTDETGDRDNRGGVERAIDRGVGIGNSEPDRRGNSISDRSLREGVDGVFVAKAPETAQEPPLRAPLPQPLPNPPSQSALTRIGPTTKLNFGCGTNRLNGWRNMDAEVNIEKPLPFTTASAQFILSCEHVVEHVPYYTAIKFFEECFRVPRAGRCGPHRGSVNRADHGLRRRRVFPLH